MVVVICNSFYDAKENYKNFLELIPLKGDIIERRWDACNCVETDDNMRYIFVDPKIANTFDQKQNDFIGEDLFFRLECMYDI